MSSCGVMLKSLEINAFQSHGSEKDDLMKSEKKTKWNIDEEEWVETVILSHRVKIFFQKKLRSHTSKVSYRTNCTIEFEK